MLEGIFHDYHEEMPKVNIDMPFLAFDPRHSLRGEEQLVEQIPTDATRFAKDYADKEMLDLVSETEQYRWPNLSEIPSDTNTDGDARPYANELDSVVLRVRRH